MKVASTNDVLAKVAINKSLLKEYSNSEYSRIVYLKDNSEFQIQIFNPYSYNIGADITIDNKSLGNRLIIKPGQRIWLERYFNEPRKFLFSTYEVSGTNRQVKEAISHNGEIKISFFKEQERIYFNSSITYHPYIYNYYDYNLQGTSATSASHYANCELTSLSALNAEDKTINCKLDSQDNIKGIRSFGITNLSKSIETGRVEKGSHSNQEFETMNIDFEYWPFRTETIKLLPESQKPIYKNDLQKQYCSNCGRKLNQKYKYCPYCGAKIDSCPNNQNKDKDYVLEKCPFCGRKVRSNMMECPHCGEILR